MPKLKIKTGDNVIVTTGKEKGKQGKVLAAFPDENKVVVEGVNLATKAKKPRNAQDKGGLIKVNQKINVSNVMLVCAGCKKPSRVGFRMENGEKVRFCKNCNSAIVAGKAVKKLKTDAKAEKAPKQEKNLEPKKETKPAAKKPEVKKEIK